MLKAAKVAKVSESSDAAASIIAPASDPPASDAAAARGDVPTPYVRLRDGMQVFVKKCVEVPRFDPFPLRGSA